MKQSARHDDDLKDAESDTASFRPPGRLRPWSLDPDDVVEIDRDLSGTQGLGTLENAAELERMASLLNLTASIMRKLARPQARRESDGLSGMADTIEGVAEELGHLLCPAAPIPRQ